MINYKLLKEKPKKINFVWDALPNNAIGVLASLGATGKSYFLLETICKYLFNKHLEYSFELPFEINFDRCYFLMLEDPQAIILERLRNILKNILKKELKGNDFDPYIDILEKYLIAFPAEKGNNLKTHMKEIEPNSFLIIDTLSVYANFKNENDNAEVGKKINELKKFLNEKQLTALLVHHLSQNGMSITTEDEITADKIRGATAIINNTRYAAIMANLKEELIYKTVKSNYKKSNSIKFNKDFFENGFKIKKGNNEKNKY
ncbi:MAG: AAA family ATPase [Arcobacter sp.]|nr:AAA family ATPase [Arcobacter sp.]